MIRIFVGWDSAEPVSYHVLSNSLLRLASRPVSITPLRRELLSCFWDRPREPDQSTEFSYSRFLVPYLCGFEGWALYLDCDVLALDDVGKLWALRDDGFAVQCVRHRHRPRELTKFLGRKQVAYDRKNWSSVMLMNCARLQCLTPDYVATATGREIKQLGFIRDEEIGSLPQEWNHLVGYDLPRPDAKLVHYTIGGPWWGEFSRVEYSLDWFLEREAAFRAEQRR